MKKNIGSKPKWNNDFTNKKIIYSNLLKNKQLNQQQQHYDVNKMTKFESMNLWHKKSNYVNYDNFNKFKKRGRWN